jgi:hypothetical protein
MLTCLKTCLSSCYQAVAVLVIMSYCSFLKGACVSIGALPFLLLICGDRFPEVAGVPTALSCKLSVVSCLGEGHLFSEVYGRRSSQFL